MNDMYNTFDYCELQYCYSHQFPYEGSRDRALVEWDYGDTQQITLNIRDCVGDIDLEECTIDVYFYNFRGEVVHTEQYVPNEEDVELQTIIITIDAETSKNKFLPGIYYLSVKLTDPDEFCDIVTTAVNRTEFKIVVH